MIDAATISTPGGDRTLPFYFEIGGTHYKVTYYCNQSDTPGTLASGYVEETNVSCCALTGLPDALNVSFSGVTYCDCFDEDFPYSGRPRKVFGGLGSYVVPKVSASAYQLDEVGAGSVYVTEYYDRTDPGGGGVCSGSVWQICPLRIFLLYNSGSNQVSVFAQTTGSTYYFFQSLHQLPDACKFDVSSSGDNLFTGSDSQTGGPCATSFAIGSGGNVEHVGRLGSVVVTRS
jgi:hypothetical protein